MKTLLAPLAALAALAAAVSPAAAQSWRGAPTYGDGRLTTAYVDSLNWKIDQAAREGRISWGEARGLHGAVREAQPLAWRVQSGQARGYEAQRLQGLVARIDTAVNGYGRFAAPRGGYQYGQGYGDHAYRAYDQGWRR